jgi:5-methylcytosine-specific restriction endonuclease McrA/transposase-like protein
MAKRYHDLDWLREKYHGEGMTQAEIAEECDVTPSAVRKWMKRNGVETRDLKGENHPLHGEERDESVKESISETLHDREYPDEWRERLVEAKQGQTIPAEVRERISDSLSGFTRPRETRRKMSESSRGENNSQWQGGHDDNYGPGWYMARQRVKQRDGVCQNCGTDGSEDRLEVHHIVPLRLFDQSEEAEKRDAHDLSNLVLLCRPCHMEAEHGDLEFESGIHPPDGVGQS